MTKIFIQFAFDALVSGWVLFYVWHHTHWSVALLLTGLTSRAVLEDLLGRLRKHLHMLVSA